MRPFKILVRGLAVLLLLCLAGMAWLFCTGTGLQVLLRLADGTAGTRIDYSDTRGSLSGGAVVNGLKVTLADGGVFAADRMEVRCRCALLLLGIVDLEQLNLAHAGWQSAGRAARGAAPFPVIPLPVNIEALHVEYVYAGGEGGSVPLNVSLRLAMRPRILRVSSLRVDTADLHVDYPSPVTLNANGHLESGGDWLLVARGRQTTGHLDLHGDLSGNTPRWDGGITTKGVELAARGNDHEATFHGRLTPFGVPNLRADLTLSGSVARQKGNVHVDAEGQWNTLDFAYRKAQIAGSGMKSRLGVDIYRGDHGWRADFNAGWDRLSLAVPPTAPLQLDDGTVTGSLAPDSLTIGSLSASTLKGKLHGSGNLTLSDQLATQWTLQGTGLDPGERWPEWPGNLDVDAALGWREGAGLSFSGGADGNLRNRPLHVEARGALAPDHVNIERLELTSGAIHASVKGSAGQELDLGWTLKVPQLAQLLPAAAGTLNSQGTLSGSRDAPRVQGSARARGVSLSGVHLQTLDARFDVDMAAGGKVDAEAEVSGLEYGRLSLDQLHGKASGNTQSNELRISARNANGSVVLHGSGKLAPDAWTGNVDEFTVASARTGSWDLQAPVNVTLAARRIEIPETCLAQSASRACAEFTRDASGKWQAALNGHEIAMALLDPVMPGNLRLRAPAELALHASGKAETISRAEGNLTLSPGSLSVASRQAGGQTLSFHSGTMHAQLDGGDLAVQSILHLSESGVSPLEANVTLHGVSPWPGDASRVAISGHVRGGVEDISSLPANTDVISEPGGRAELDVGLGGTLAAPSLAGNVALKDGEFNVLDLGTHVHDIGLTVSETDPDHYRIAGQFSSGTGQVQVTGSAQALPVRLDTRFSGEKFEAVNLPEIWALVAPELEFRWNRQTSRVAGKIVVSPARIHLEELESRTQLSSDVEVTGVAQHPAADRLPISPDLDVTVILGDDVQVSGRGISGDLTGQVKVHRSADGRTLGNGEIRIQHGKLSAYGQSLDVETGRLIFHDNEIGNPQVSLVASRDKDDVKVGINVSGYLANPVVTLFSSPSMSQEQILSYIVFGRPLTGLSGGDGADLISAAAAMGLQNNGMLKQSLASTFGLSELSVKTDATNASASLIVGKYLSPRLYLSYGIGLFEALNSAKLRYDLSKRWSVEAERSHEMGFDVLYKLER